jgi:hypothetical protein
MDHYDTVATQAVSGQTVSCGPADARHPAGQVSSHFPLPLREDDPQVTIERKGRIETPYSWHKFEFLDSPATGLADIDIAIQVNGHAVRRHDLSALATI